LTSTFACCNIIVSHSCVVTSNSLTVTGSSTLLSNSSGIGAGTPVAGNGGTETITFTLNATVKAGEANQTINLSGLSFTLTPQ
jgi:hypothetical protein